MNSPEIPPELLEQAERALGDGDHARDWFFRPNANLGGARPLDAIEADGQDAVAVILDARSAVASTAGARADHTPRRGRALIALLLLPTLATLVWWMLRLRG